MAPVSRRKAETSLGSKGFREEAGTGGAHQRFTYYDLNGKRTQRYFFFSRGSGYAQIGDDLQNRAKEMLGLRRRQDVEDLLRCTMSQEEYEDAVEAAASGP